MELGEKKGEGGIRKCGGCVLVQNRYIWVTEIASTVRSLHTVNPSSIPGIYMVI